ncbi:MAG: hypothetical protein RL624_1867, partial [Bacteroidota bacterium]
KNNNSDEETKNLIFEKFVIKIKKLFNNISI